MRLATAALAVLVLSASALPAVAADDLSFLGPAPARNFQPIQLIFLQLPFERAVTVGRGLVAVTLQSAEINEIATTKGNLVSELKFEANRTVFGARYGFAEGWEIGIDMPFITRYGGFLDPIIDEVEGLFGAGNPERDLWKNNTFGAFSVRRGDLTLFEGGKETFAPGDLWLSFKREMPLAERWPLLAFRAAVKMPSGDEDRVLGSGKIDFGTGLVAEYQAHRRVALYLNVDLVYPLGPITPARFTLNPIFTEAFAAEIALSRRWSVELHQAVYTSPMHGTGTRLLDGAPVELGLGVNFAATPSIGLQLMGIDNVSGVEQAADFTLLFAASYRLRSSPGKARAEGTR